MKEYYYNLFHKHIFKEISFSLWTLQTFEEEFRKSFDFCSKKSSVDTFYDALKLTTKIMSDKTSDYVFDIFYQKFADHPDFADKVVSSLIDDFLKKLDYYEIAENIVYLYTKDKFEELLKENIINDSGDFIPEYDRPKKEE